MIHVGIGRHVLWCRGRLEVRIQLVVAVIEIGRTHGVRLGVRNRWFLIARRFQITETKYWGREGEEEEKLEKEEAWYMDKWGGSIDSVGSLENEFFSDRFCFCCFFFFLFFFYGWDDMGTAYLQVCKVKQAFLNAFGIGPQLTVPLHMIGKKCDVQRPSCPRGLWWWKIG